MLAMMIYAYCIVWSEAAIPPLLRGVHGAHLGVVIERPLGLVVSNVELNATRPLPTEDSLRQHGAVVETLATPGPVLPLRFGTILPTVHVAREYLRRNGPVLQSALSRLSGKAQISVWFTSKAGSSDTLPATVATPVETDATAATPSRIDGQVAGSGTAYLAEKLAEHRLMKQRKKQAALLLEPVHERLLAISHEGRLEFFADDTWLGRAAYLVDAGTIAEFRRLLRQMEQEQSAFACFTSELRAPYDFAESALTSVVASQGGEERGIQTGVVQIRRWNGRLRAKSPIRPREH